MPLVAMDNIDTFNKAAVEYGMPESATFLSNDLYEAHKATFVNVINCLNKLGHAVRLMHLYNMHTYIQLYIHNGIIFVYLHALTSGADWD